MLNSSRQSSCRPLVERDDDLSHPLLFLLDLLAHESFPCSHPFLRVNLEQSMIL